jgi:hypothetical protein
MDANLTYMCRNPCDHCHSLTLVSCLCMQEHSCEDLLNLNTLTQLTLLSLTARLCDRQLGSLKFGANMMVRR